MYPQLNPQVSYFPSNGCLPLTVQLNDITPALPCGTANHNWQISGGAYEWESGNSFDDYNPSVIFLEEAIYTVELHHSVPGLAVCPEAIESFEIEVYDVPLIDITTSGTICEGESWTVEIANISDGSDPSVNYSWLLDGSFYSSDPNLIIIPLYPPSRISVFEPTPNTLIVLMPFISFKKKDNSFKLFGLNNTLAGPPILNQDSLDKSSSNKI